ncbi:MAG: hypothetical protein ACRDQ0_20135, partial [Pseudonocardia sp.]
CARSGAPPQLGVAELPGHVPHRMLTAVPAAAQQYPRPRRRVVGMGGSRALGAPAVREAFAPQDYGILAA